jgi:hypothetical protein
MLKNISPLKCKIILEGNSPDWPAIKLPSVWKIPAFKLASDSMIGKRKFSQTSGEMVDSNSIERDGVCFDFKLYSS